MLHGVEWLGRQYSALSKGSGANSTVVQTITTLASRLTDSSQSENPAQEKRGAVLSLKGLAKDHPKDVSTYAGKQLLDFLIHEVTKPPNANGAPSDDVSRSLIETLLTLCTPTEQPQHKISFGRKPPQPPVPIALDQFLETPQPLHALLPLLSPNRSFYLRFSAIQLLALVLRHRKTAVQSHVLTSPGGCGAILECLSTTSPSGHSLGSSAEIIRNEALLLLPHLVDANADIQKLIAFEGAFEKLLDVVAQEGRIEGGVVVQDALEALEALLRYNVSNQNYFRETLSIPMLAPLLFYPPPLPPNAPAHLASQRDEQLEGFAFQPWEYDASDEFDQTDAHQNPDQPQNSQPTGPRIVGDVQKLINARLVIGIAGLLVQGVGEGKRANQNALLSTGFFHALLDLALGSSAPVPLKTQALQVLASLLQQSRNVQDALGEAAVTPVEPIKVQLAADLAQQQQQPASQTETRASSDAAPLSAQTPYESKAVEYARLPPSSALLVLIQAALNGIPPPHRPIDGGYPSVTGFRAAAVKALQSILGDNIDARLFVVASMASAEQSKPEEQPGAVLLEALTLLPTNGQADGFDEFKALFAGMILNSAIKGSDTVKDLALRLRYSADGGIKVLPQQGDDKHDGKGAGAGAANDQDDDDDASILSVLIGNITVALRSQGDAVKTERQQTPGSVIKGPTSTSWTRILIAHLTLLALWLHKSPKSVAHVVNDSSNVQAIVQLVAEGANGESLLVGLGTWVLGILYEWGPAPRESPQDGVMTRKEIHDLTTSRIGLDQYEAKLERLRDDARLRLVGPDVLDKIGHRPDPVTAASASHAKDGAVAAQFGKPTHAQATADTADDDLALTDIWFDWTWAEFWRNESVTISNALLVAPGTTSAEAASAPAELLDAQRQIEQLRDEVKRLQREVEAREHSLNDASTRNAAHEQDIESLRASLDSLRLQLENTQADSGKSAEAAQTQFNASQDRVTQAERSLAEEKARRDEVTERLAGAEEQVRILKEQLASVDTTAKDGAQSQTNGEELAAASARVAELQSANDSIKSELESVQASSKELQTKLEAAEADKTKLVEEIETAKKQSSDAASAEKKRGEEALEAEKKKWEEQLEQTKKSHQEALSTAAAEKRKSQPDASANRRNSVTSSAAANKKHAEELAKAKSDAQEAKKKHDADLAAAKRKAEADLKAAEKKHSEAQKKHADGKKKADDQVKKAEDEIALLKKQLEEAKKSSGAGGDASEDSSSSRISELEQENQDLLVMLDELSTKRKKDKARLKEKGEEVSEDEEDDDEDE